MNYLLVQLVLARNRDFDDWVNILFVVVIAIFWAVGGAIKARANKSRREDKEELVRKPPQRGRGLEEQPLQQPSRAAGPVQRQWRPEVQQRRGMVGRIQPAVVSKPAAKVKEPGWFPTLESPEVSKLPTLRGVIEEPQELITKPIEGLKDRQLGIRPEPGVDEPVLDFDDPEKLRRAILHYEILGKPLSLRGPPGHTL